MNITKSIYRIYPNVVRTVGDIAYDAEGNEVAYNLQAVTIQAQKDECKAQAKALLAQSDWSVLPDVGLANAADYVAYRGILRGLVTQPQVSPNFPTIPEPIWS